jgi:hypothetical protein
MTLALSIRQPFASLILIPLKDVENRDWWTGLRGPFLVHAAKGMTRAEYADAMNFAKRICSLSQPELLPLLESESFAFENLPRGGIIGSAVLRDCVKRCGSPWFRGKYGFLLGDQRKLPFAPYKGERSFFDVAELTP